MDYVDVTSNLDILISDYSFASSLGLKIQTSRGTIETYRSLVRTLTERYLLPVKLLGVRSGRYSVSFLVPETLNYTQIGWIYEVLKYYSPMGVDIIILIKTK
jgi:hypothetical protein